MGIAFSALPCLGRQAPGLRQCPSARMRTPVPLPLPTDVVLGILSRIPLKSLFRLRCVSREWSVLVSDSIVTVYKSRGEPLLAAGSSCSHKSLRLIDMDGNVVKVIRRNLGSAVWRLICTSRDDLVCVISSSCDVQVIDLADGKVLLTCRRSGLFGFGCAIPSRRVYKVICISPSRCEILTVGDAAGWRRMRLPPSSNIISYTSNPVVVNGVLHMMLKSSQQLDGNSVVLCFDLASEVWKKGIKGPPDVEIHQCLPRFKCDPALSELNGSLCMVQPKVQSYGTNIWLLTDSNNSTWVKVFTVPLDLSWFHRLIPLRILCDGKRLLFCNFSENRDLSWVQIYDAQSLKFTDAPKALAGVHKTNFSPCF